MPTRRLTLPGTFELGGAIAPNTCAALVMLAAVAPAARQLSALGCLRWLIGRLRAPAPVGIRVITVTTALVVATGVMLMAILNRPVPNHVTIPACVVSALLGSMTSTYYVVNERRMVIEAHLLATVEALDLSVSRLRQEAWIG